MYFSISYNARARVTCSPNNLMQIVAFFNNHYRGNPVNIYNVLCLRGRRVTCKHILCMYEYVVVVKPYNIRLLYLSLVTIIHVDDKQIIIIM